MRNNKFKFFLIIFFIFLSNCATKPEKPLVRSNVPKNLIAMKGFNLIQTINGAKKIEVDADEAQVYLKEKLMKFYNVQTKYFDKGKEISNLRSNEGTIYTDTNNMEVSGQVVLTTQANTTLETEKLKWSEKNNKLFTDEHVKITRGDNVMTGIGLESDLMLENVVMKETTTKITDLKSLEERKK
ncbi:MAG: LPS export ABC transporter periplasmic protein LptC [Candidatus Firestonebacteria bacterium]